MSRAVESVSPLLRAKFPNRAVNRGDGDAEVAHLAVGRGVLDFAALERLAVAQACREHPRQIGIGAEDFLVRAVAHRAGAESAFRRGIGGADRAGGVDEQKASGHVARDFFGEPLGFLRALLGEQVQPRQFLFLRAQFFDHALHRRRHECGWVLHVGPGT